MPAKNKPLVGISACLLGENVRYDGGNRLQPLIRDEIGNQVEFISICPEAESGMGVPREPMQLVNRRGTIHILTKTTQRDMTPQLQRWKRQKLLMLQDLPLCGYILKARSPSCGLVNVECRQDNGSIELNEPGLFAKGLLQAFPRLPVVEEEDLEDELCRKNFIEAVFDMHRQYQTVSVNDT